MIGARFVPDRRAFQLNGQVLLGGGNAFDRHIRKGVIQNDILFADPVLKGAAVNDKRDFSLCCVGYNGFDVGRQGDFGEFHLYKRGVVVAFNALEQNDIAAGYAFGGFIVRKGDLIAFLIRRFHALYPSGHGISVFKLYFFRSFGCGLRAFCFDCFRIGSQVEIPDLNIIRSNA